MPSKRLRPLWWAAALGSVAALGVLLNLLPLPTATPEDPYWDTNARPLSSTPLPPFPPSKAPLSSQIDFGADPVGLGSCTDEDRAFQATIITDTARWRNASWSFYYGGYPGPWIEETFFNHYQGLTDSHRGCPIGGRFYVPIYYNHVYRSLKEPQRLEVGEYLATLDRGRRYFTVLLLSKGLTILGFEMPEGLDLMIFAGGGATPGASVSNVPIPLLIREQRLEELPPLPKEVGVSFAGSLETHPVRRELEGLFGHRWRFHSGHLDNQVQDWVALTRQSVFCLAPRGFGISSFRIFESIQLGCIPVYIWEDEFMLPFTDFLDWNSVLVATERRHVGDLDLILEAADVLRLQSGVAAVRHMMTYNYTCRYIVNYVAAGLPGKRREEFFKLPPRFVSY